MTSNGVNGTTEPLERNGSPAVRPKSPPIQSPAANPSLVPPKSSPTLEGKDLGVRSPLANGDRPDSSGTDRDAPNDSEAETVVLNGEESPHKKQGKAVKHERDDEDEDLARRKKMAKSEPASSSKHSEPERRRSTEPEKPSSKPRLASEKSDAKRNGLSRSENSGAEPASNEQLHSPKTEPPNSPGSRTKLQERSSSTVETKKRKIREEHHLKNIEPPRQRHRSDGPGKDSAVHSLRNQPTSPPTPNGRPHRRSLSTQTVQQPLAQTRKRRDVANLNIHDHDRYSDSSSETSSSPRPQHQAVPRLKRSSHRALTSPVRGMPPKKNIDRFGATRLARDCEKGDLELVKQDFELAPEELDQVDFAGIAPLQKAALNGHADVVEFLIKKGCRTDCMSSDHDTPLIDATENGHVDVVRLLLEVGHVNPHHQNRKGQRALDAIDEDNEETAEELKALLNEYMLKEPLEENDSAKSTTLAQAMQSESASNLLYNEYNVETLRDKAAEGDVGAVAQLISADIKPNNACGIAASRGGHDDVLSLLLAVGLKADPDPAKHSETPMTVAIGRGHLKVITLLLDQDNFDPTRRNREGKTYWELSEERRGPRWQQERELLKLRYDSHKTQRSPNSRRRQAGQAASSSKHLKRE
ncbi:ankyrin, partial [Patellaria atrata CBS 101060]